MAACGSVMMPMNESTHLLLPYVYRKRIPRNTMRMEETTIPFHEEVVKVEFSLTLCVKNVERFVILVLGRGLLIQGSANTRIGHRNGSVESLQMTAGARIGEDGREYQLLLYNPGGKTAQSNGSSLECLQGLATGAEGDNGLGWPRIGRLFVYVGPAMSRTWLAKDIQNPRHKWRGL
jgi:hypothetical protein